MPDISRAAARIALLLLLGLAALTPAEATAHTSAAHEGHGGHGDHARSEVSAPTELGPQAVGKPRVSDDDFQKVTLNDRPGEPMGLAVLPSGRVLTTSRNGDVRLHDPRTGLNTFAARLPVYEHDEEGLQSIAIDPDFRRNRWVYLYYSPVLRTPLDDPATPGLNEGDAPGTGTSADFAPFRGVLRLSRFKYRDARIIRGSEQRIIDVPVNRGICCHVGGHIDFDGDGNLLLSTGDDTFPFSSGGYTPIEERLEFNPAFDAQRSSSNTNDLRGKLLRIRPRSRLGGYTIPDGNLFPVGTARTRPEIYAMGLRNPFRFAVDRRTNDVFMADYSPDALVADPLRGPPGYGKWTVIRRPGNYGWPYCATAELPYVDYDFATSESGSAFNCDHPVNDSPRNSGLSELPPVVQPGVWYTYGPSSEFPDLGYGGIGPMAGPAYDADAVRSSRRRWPVHYDGAPLFYEWTRDYVRAFRVGEGGGVTGIEPVLSSLVLDNPMDLEFGPDGALYVLEYGDGFNNENPEAQLSRVDYVRGGRTPIPAATAQPSQGEPPLRIRFSGAGSIDPDGDRLRYEWHFDDDGRVDSRLRNPVHTFRRRGVFEVTLRVVDPSGRSAATSVQVQVGVTPPLVSLQVDPPAGEPFRFGQTVSYQLTIDDGPRPIECQRASVTYSLGHDEHAHAQTTAVGCSGTIRVEADNSHSGANSLAGVFSAEYLSSAEGDETPLVGTDEVVLVPAQRSPQAE